MVKSAVVAKTGEMWLVAEVFSACGAELGAVLETVADVESRDEADTVAFAVKVVLYVCGKVGRKATAVTGREIGRAFGVGIFEAVARLPMHADWSADLLHDCMRSLGAVLEADGEGEGINDALRGNGFRLALHVVRRELRASNGIKRVRVSDMARAAAAVVVAVHSTPRSWTAARVALRKEGDKESREPYSLVALMLTNSSDEVVLSACDLLMSEMYALNEQDDVKSKKQLLTDAFENGGCYSALLSVLRKPGMTRAWSYNLGLFKALSYYVDKNSGQICGILSMEPEKDKALIYALLDNAVDLCDQITSVPADVTSDLERMLTSVLETLHMLYDISGEDRSTFFASFSNSDLTKLLLRSLVALNNLDEGSGVPLEQPSCVSACPHIGKEKPCSHVVMKLVSSLLYFFSVTSCLKMEHSAFLSVPGGIEAIVWATPFAIIFAVEAETLEQESSPTVLRGLMIIREFSVPIRDSNGAGGSVVSLFSFLMRNAQWREAECCRLRTTGYAVLLLNLFLIPTLDSGATRCSRNAFGQACSLDESVIKGLLTAIYSEEVVVGSDLWELVFTVFVSLSDCLMSRAENLSSTELAQIQASALALRLRAGVFSLVPHAALKCTSTGLTQNVSAVRHILALACTVKDIGNGSCTEGSGYLALGRASLAELSDNRAGSVLKFLDETKLSSESADCFRDMVGILGNFRSETRDFCSASDCRSSKLAAFRFKLKKCPYRGPRYCCVACQKKHWTVHKMTCSARRR